MLLRSVLAKALVDKGQWLTRAMLLQALFIQDESDAVHLHIGHFRLGKIRLALADIQE